MRTILIGVRATARTPEALLPLTAEGVFGALLVWTGVLPSGGSIASATAVFPLDIYFDVKHALASTSSWWLFSVVVGAGIIVRGTVLSGTLWLAEEVRGSFLEAWRRGIAVVAPAALALLPAAAAMFAGTAIRYAPFIWAGAALAIVPVVWFARRGLNLDVGGGAPESRRVPEVAAYLAYAYAIGGIAALLAVLSNLGAWATGALLVFLGPLHALVLIGWRKRARDGVLTGSGGVVVAVTVVAVGGLFAASFYDRYLRTTPPVGTVSARGTLLLLGGVDSTWRSGALSGLDPRDLGFRREDARYLSYVAGRRYRAEDTRRDLGDIATDVAPQIADAGGRTVMVGHSQAGLILDRILVRDLAAPARSAVLAAPPPGPAPLHVPPPGHTSVGKPGGDLTRGLAWVVGLFGVEPFDVDAPNSPVNLRSVMVDDPPIPRLSVWPLADSVWLSQDWRRPGELNVVAITDHVGVVNDGRALDAVRIFLSGRRIEVDATSWRGALVAAFRYAFEPWRPSIR